jgi:hypothetical protein
MGQFLSGRYAPRGCWVHQNLRPPPIGVGRRKTRSPNPRGTPGRCKKLFALGEKSDEALERVWHYSGLATSRSRTS